MKKIKNLCLAILFVILFSCAATADAQTKKKKVVKSKKPVSTAKKRGVKKPIMPPSRLVLAENMPLPEYKVLLAGNYSKVDAPFVFIARDAETYALLRSLVEGLPASSTVDFTKTAVVAAFAGERNTGGWSVAIRPVQNRAIVDIREPRKDAMVTQVITTPFQIALVPVASDQALALELTATWTNRMATYRVTKGDFESSGGIAGRVKKFSAEGTIRALRFGDHVTYSFDLTGKGGDRARRLVETSSGVVNAGQIEIARLDAGSFAEMPHPPLKATATAATEQKLAITFTSHPPTVADGFMAQGKLEAVRSK